MVEDVGGARTYVVTYLYSPRIPPINPNHDWRNANCDMELRKFGNQKAGVISLALTGTRFCPTHEYFAIAKYVRLFGQNIGGGQRDVQRK
jgi:hypothetical protein